MMDFDRVKDPLWWLMGGIGCCVVLPFSGPFQPAFAILVGILIGMAYPIVRRVLDDQDW
jgi:hypothetical protein